MKQVLTGALAAALLAGAASDVQASSHKGPKDGKRVLACYEKLFKPAKYKVSKVLVKPVKQQYEWHGGLYKLVEYPAVYREVREEIEPGYYLMREVPCK